MRVLQRASDTRKSHESSAAWWAIACVALLLLPATARAATITVNSTADVAANDGACTLREAILAANTNTASGAAAGECAAGAVGLDTIAFALPGAGVQTITAVLNLPAITEPVFINGYSQPLSGPNSLAVGDNAVILVEIDFNNLAAAGFTINASAPGSVVQGLAIKRAGGSALIMVLGDNSKVQGNFLGTNAAGTAVGPGSSYGVFVGAVNVLVGGTAPSERNVISGNSANINVQSLFGVVPSAVIQGNYLGTNASGTAAITSNYGVVAIAGTGNALGTVTIGGTTAGAGNLVSGNLLNGIRIDLGGGGGTLGGATIQGNIVGLDATGVNALPNGGDGIAVLKNASATMGPVLIGGATPAARNVVSSSTNSAQGILLNGSPATTTVLGNFIGTDVTGTVGRPNQANGILLQNGAATIGGAAAGAGNLIAANLNGGILVSDSTATILGNFIGTQIDGVTPLTNGGFGVNVTQGFSATQATLGGVAPGEANRILIGASQTGVAVRGTTARAAIRGNSIAMSAAGGFPISLQSTFPTANDACDADTGPNLLQNFPVLTSAAIAAGSVTVTGTLNAAASTTFQVDIFSSPACNSFGFGPGRTYLGSATVTTDVTCNGSFNVALPIGAGETVITATATDPAGNTSEFSACLVAGAGPTPTPTPTPTATATPTVAATPTPTLAATPTPTSGGPANASNVPALSEGMLAWLALALVGVSLLLLRKAA
jgi:CSLREA domain-containing protein